MSFPASNDADHPPAQHSLALSPAALWLASFSPPSGDTIPTPVLFDNDDVNVESTLDELTLSPAAQYLRAFSSPPPSSPKPAHATTEEVAGYRLGRTLGQGISQVRLATSALTGAVVAVKIVPSSLDHQSSAKQVTRLREEEQIWSALSHEYILPLLSVHRAPDFTAFFTLYCPDGSLLDLLTKGRGSKRGLGLEGDLVRSLFRQISRGVAYLHNTMRIVHGDIKLENILIDDSGNARLADFGCAQYIEVAPSSAAPSPAILQMSGSHHPHITHHISLRRDHNTARRGRPRQASDSVQPSLPPSPDQTEDDVLHASLPYAAPEVLRRTSSTKRTHQSALPPQDIWALGCVLHGLLTGFLPFTDAYEPRLHLKILNGEWESRSPTIDGDRVILRACLRVEPGERWTIDKLEAHAHEVGAVDYTRLQRNASKSRSRVRYVQSHDSSSSREGSCERRGSRDRSTSRTRRVWPGALDIHSNHHGRDPYPLPQYHHRHDGTDIVEEDDEDDDEASLPGTRRVRRTFSSESRGAPSVSEVFTPTDDTFLASLTLRDSSGRSRSRGRTMAGRQVALAGMIISNPSSKDLRASGSRGRRGISASRQPVTPANGLDPFAADASIIVVEDDAPASLTDSSPS